jgi:hypothetical protein
MTALLELPGAELRELAGLADARDRRRSNNLQALYGGPTPGAFASGAPSLPRLSREIVQSAMSALAFHGFTVAGLLRSAEGFAAGRLPPEILDGVVAAVAARRDRGQL